MESIQNRLDSYAGKFDDTTRGLCASFARMFEIEELVESALSRD